MSLIYESRQKFSTQNRPLLSGFNPKIPNHLKIVIKTPGVTRHENYQKYEDPRDFLIYLGKKSVDFFEY